MTGGRWPRAAVAHVNLDLGCGQPDHHHCARVIIDLGYRIVIPCPAHRSHVIRCTDA
jgi:hypothetical protein